MGRSVRGWLGEGGFREDDGSLLLGNARYFRHFHDPLQPWDRSGLRLFLIGQYDSSIRWMQLANQNAQTRGTGSWSWQDARRFYATALTATSVTEQEQAWADTFRALGHVTHLVVDASVPEHSRNDPHPLGRLYGNYEYWVEREHGASGSAEEGLFIQRYLSAPSKPDPGILLQPTGDTAAPVPVARLIDTNRYTGADPNVTLAAPIGIAEFANANFFSEDTRHGDYPFPSVERLMPSQHPVPKTGRVRAYYKKGLGDGLAVDPVLAECALDEAAWSQGISRATYYTCVDENVWAQTAAATLPRAVGYSAALLDYFFRGRLEVRLENEFPGAGDPLALRVINRTPGETMDGTLAMYDETPGGRQLLTSWDLTLPPDAEAALDAPPRPPDATPTPSYLLVFRGRLGDEPDAVVAQRIAFAGYYLELYPDWPALVSLFRVEDVTYGSNPFLVAFARKGDFGNADAATYVYRNLESLPGDVAAVQADGWCSLGPTAATFELVEVEEPRNLAELLGYRIDALPRIRRVLRTFTVLGFDAPITLDVAGVRFFGVRLISEPPTVGVCGGSAWIVLPQPE